MGSAHAWFEIRLVLGELLKFCSMYDRLYEATGGRAKGNSIEYYLSDNSESAGATDITDKEKTNLTSSLMIWVPCLHRHLLLGCQSVGISIGQRGMMK